MGETIEIQARENWTRTVKVRLPLMCPAKGCDADLTAPEAVVVWFTGVLLRHGRVDAKEGDLVDLDGGDGGNWDEVEGAECTECGQVLFELGGELPSTWTPPGAPSKGAGKRINLPLSIADGKMLRAAIRALDPEVLPAVGTQKQAFALLERIEAALRASGGMS